jgi:hypothetical protein
MRLHQVQFGDQEALKISWIMRRERCLDAILLSAKLSSLLLNAFERFFASRRSLW